jgi:hypothetical protein
MATAYYVTSATFTRPADTTAYASGDLVANSTTAASVAPLSLQMPVSSGIIRRARIEKSDETDVANASFRVHLYTSSPTVSNGDNSAWLSTVAGYLGSLDVTVDKAFTTVAVGVGGFASGHSDGIFYQLSPSGTTVYALLEARAAYSPASAETFAVALEIEA